MLQVWLQYFAWTEGSLSAKVQSRSNIGSQQDTDSLAKEPMFCFETAIKMLYWCGLAYEYNEVIIYVFGQLCQSRYVQCLTPVMTCRICGST